jgi:hypothetical protein
MEDRTKYVQIATVALKTILNAPADWQMANGASSTKVHNVLQADLILSCLDRRPGTAAKLRKFVAHVEVPDSVLQIVSDETGQSATSACSDGAQGLGPNDPVAEKALNRLIQYLRVLAMRPRPTPGHVGWAQWLACCGCF